MKWWVDKEILARIYPSVAERRIIKILDEIGVQYFREVSFEGLVSEKGYPLRFDFYLPRRNLLIEYDGASHREAAAKPNDHRKNAFARKNKITLRRLNKRNWKNLDQRIKAIVLNSSV